MSSYQMARYDLAKALADAGAVSGLTQEKPNLGALTMKIVEHAAQCMRFIQLDCKLDSDTVNAVIGIPRRGNLFARELSRLCGKKDNFFELKKSMYLEKQRIESIHGQVSWEIWKVLLVDDLINRGESACEAIQVLRDDDIRVTDAIVLVDCERGGREALEKWACNLHSVFTARELLRFCANAGKIKPENDHNLYPDLASFGPS